MRRRRVLSRAGKLHGLIDGLRSVTADEVATSCAPDIDSTVFGDSDGAIVAGIATGDGLPAKAAAGN